jgi:hypothetical protein
MRLRVNRIGTYRCAQPDNAVAKQRRIRFPIGLLVLALTVPAVSIAQTPPAPGNVARCTEAAPCATPGTRTTPGRKAPSAASIRQFRETHPCPTTAHSFGACPGYVVTHITPPCKGGLDTPENLQWQTHANADRQAQTACR